MAAVAAESRTGGATETAEATALEGGRPQCCSLYHHAIELVGKRWTGAILLVLMDGPLHFSGVRHLVPELSDRLLSERLKELEAEGIVERRVLDGSPVRVEYSLTAKGRALEPTLVALKEWARQHVSGR
jgi:DNA-binding HxlR family transcriptional regulator